MRIDDDSHVQVDHLESFLSRLDPERPLFIGAPGLVSAHCIYMVFSTYKTKPFKDLESMKKISSNLDLHFVWVVLVLFSQKAF